VHGHVEVAWAVDEKKYVYLKPRVGGACARITEGRGGGVVAKSNTVVM
jgi:hypothetical protein